MGDQHTSLQRAFLVDPGLQCGLAALLNDTPVTLLPIASKPLVQHWIERLSTAGITEITLLLSHLPDKTREFVGDGSRWGVTVKTALLRSELPPGKLFAHLREHLDETSFISDINRFPLENAVQWLQATSPETGCCYSFPGEEQSFSSAFSEQTTEAGSLTLSQPAGDGLYRPVLAPGELWQLNMDLLDGVIVDPHPAGFELAAGVRTGVNYRQQKSTKLESPAVIGDSVILGERVKIGSRAVLGNNVIADEGSQVVDSIVFDRTFIGSHTTLEKVIAAGSLLYRVEDDMQLHIDDAEILSHGTDGKRAKPSTLQRILALALAGLLFLPAMLRAILLLVTGKPVFKSQTIYLDAGSDFSGSRRYREVPIKSLNTEHPGWRKLPWLVAVIKGELLLTGTTPRTDSEHEIPEWFDAALYFPGVITLADVTGATLNGNEYSEDSLIADSYQVAKGGGETDINLVWRWVIWLFKPNKG